MNESQRIKIVYCCNDKVFEGVYLSILSILRRSKSTFDFFLLTGNLTKIRNSYQSFSPQHTKIIKDLVKSFNKDNSFTVIDCEEIYYKALGNNKARANFHTPFASFRLLLEYLPQFTGKVIYLDTDTMANGDIKELYDINVDGYELAGAHDINKIRQKQTNNKYINSGVLLLNMDVIRQTHLLNKAFAYLIENRPLFFDQDSINFCLTKLKFFPNEQRFNYLKPKIEDDTVMKHFINYPYWNIFDVNTKPWQVKKVRWIKHLHNWDEDYKIFKKARKEWKKIDKIKTK